MDGCVPGLVSLCRRRALRKQIGEMYLCKVVTAIGPPIALAGPPFKRLNNFVAASL